MLGLPDMNKEDVSIGRSYKIVLKGPDNGKVAIAVHVGFNGDVNLRFKNGRKVCFHACWLEPVVGKMAKMDEIRSKVVATLVNQFDEFDYSFITNTYRTYWGEDVEDSDLKKSVSDLIGIGYLERVCPGLFKRTETLEL